MKDAAAYGRILEKFKWAQQHIDNLTRLALKFRDDYPDAVVPESNESTGEVLYRVSYIPTIPSEVALTFGDALQNLRSTLDHLACALVTAAGNNVTSQTAFPIFDTADEYWERMARKVKGMGQSAIEAINSIQPYERGVGHALWQLHRLNNLDKHRILLPVACINVSRSSTPSEIREFRSRFEQIHGVGSSGNVKLLVSFSNREVVPLRAGNVLFTAPVSEVNQDMKFPIDMAINESEVAKGIPIINFLGFASTEVHRIVERMAPHL
jgi:hypothetical protein